MESNEEENRSVASNCIKCGKAILDKESSFCAYCGAPFDSKAKGVDLTGGAGLLAVIAATFSIAVGVTGLTYYRSYVAYLASYGLDASAAVGFLMFAVFALVSSAFGFVGGVFAFAKKHLMVSVSGILVMLASALFTFAAVERYDYGVTESLLLPGISIGALSVVAAIFLLKSRSEFAQD